MGGKLSISMTEELARRIRQAAEQAGESVSAWLADAAERRLKLEAGRALLSEWEAEHGAISADELAHVRARWPV